MKIKALSLLGVTAILMAPPHAAVTGQVLDESNSRGLANAIVQVKPSGVLQLTDAAGRFDMSATSIQQVLGSPLGLWQLTRQGRQVTLMSRRSMRSVAVEIISLSGQALATVYKGSVPAGRTTWLLPQALPPYGLLRVRTSGKTSLSPFPGSAHRVLSKEAAEPETLVVSCYGYRATQQVLTGSDAVQVKLQKMSGEIVPPGMRSLAGGMFIMGDDNADADESPAHEVEVDGFFLDTTEVMQSDYQALTGRRPWVYNKDIIDGLPARQKHPLHPAWGLNWFDAALYCNKRSKRDGLDTVYSYSKVICDSADNCVAEGIQSDLTRKGYRLPTEAEWEYACRAGTSTKFFWGKSALEGLDFVWANQTSEYSTHAVANKKPNAFNLYDMQGSIQEWMEDWDGIGFPVDEAGALVTKNPVQKNGCSLRCT